MRVSWALAHIEAGIIHLVFFWPTVGTSISVGQRQVNDQTEIEFLLLFYGFKDRSRSHSQHAKELSLRQSHAEVGFLIRELIWPMWDYL